MNIEKDSVALSATKAIAERVLTETFHGTVLLDEGGDLGGSKRSLVLRFPVVEGPVQAPGSVIVKRAANADFDSDTSNESAWLLFNEPPYYPAFC